LSEADACHRFVFRAMACDNELQLVGDAAAAARMAEQVMAEVRRIEAKYSRYRADSVVARINGGAGGEPVTIDLETERLLDYAHAAWLQSGGRFDITSGVLRQVWDFRRARLPDDALLARALRRIGWDKVERGPGWVRLPEAGMELDFGGFGKEYAVDSTADLCLAAGWRQGLVNLGGDLRVLGPQADGRPWRICLRHPRAPEQVLATVLLSEGGLASSGDYERYMDVAGRRYCHILDPHSGYPSQGWQSVSVTATRCLLAGTVSTVAMLHDAAGGLDWLRRCGQPYLAVAVDGSVHDGFPVRQNEHEVPCMPQPASQS